MTDTQTQSLKVLSGVLDTDKATLTQIIKAAKAANDEPVFKITHEGLFFRAMDKTHVSLIDMVIPNSSFENIGIVLDGDKINGELVFSVDAIELLRLLRSFEKKGTVFLDINQNRVKVSQNGFSTSLRVLDNSFNECPLPKIPYEFSVNFGKDATKEFIQTLKKMQTQNDYVTLSSFDNGTLEIFGQTTKAKFTMQNDIFVSSDNCVSTSYSLEYLKPFLQSIPAKSEIDLGFSNIKPLRIESRVNDQKWIHFYLAPRVEN